MRRGKPPFNSSFITPHSSLNREHPVEGDARPRGGLFGHGDLVDYVAGAQRVERPGEVLRGDAVHRGAHAEVGREQADLFVRVLLDQTVDEIDLGADGPGRACGRSLNRLDDELGRAGEVCLLDDRALALRVHQNLYAGHLRAHLIHVPGAEATVDGAVALPEDEARTSQLVRGVAAEFFVRIPQRHLFKGETEANAGVAPQVLVWEEEELVGLLQILLEERHGVRGGADHAAALAAEGFDRGAGVHVGDGDDLELVEHAYATELLPGVLDLFGGRHVGHRAARSEVWQDNFLVAGLEYVGGFGHEVDAAEDYEVCFGPPGGKLRELEGVARVVGVADYVVALVMVAEDDESRAQAPSCRLDALVQLRLRHPEVVFERRRFR